MSFLIASPVFFLKLMDEEELLPRYFERINELITNSKVFCVEGLNFTRNQCYERINLKRFSRFYSKYRLKNTDDLINLIGELNSFITNPNDFNESDKKYIELNKDNYRKRMGLNPNYVLSEKQANKIIKTIEKIWKGNIFHQLFVNTNIRDFFERYNIEYDASNVAVIADIFLIFAENEALNFYVDNGGVLENYSWFRDTVFERGDEFMVNTIMHEFIHCIQIALNDDPNGFCYQYSDFNEYLTEYIAREAAKKFLDIQDYNENISSEKYDYGIKLISILENKEFFKDLIRAKLYNDRAKLLEKMSVRDIEKINLFFLYINNSDDIEKEKLDYIIKEFTKEIEEINANIIKKSKR